MVLSLLAAMGLVHALMTLVLSADQASDFLVLFAFIPARYNLRLLSELWWVSGWGAAVWTFLLPMLSSTAISCTSHLTA